MRRSRLGRTIGAGLLVVAATAWADGPSPTAPPPGVPSSAERSLPGRASTPRRRRTGGGRPRRTRRRSSSGRRFPRRGTASAFSLRQQGKYPEAVKAYDRALKLRPDYAEALEYLGEAYVKMGKLDEARAVLGRLEPLDKKEAAELRAAIEKAKK